jgi:hypothetical protein
VEAPGLSSSELAFLAALERHQVRYLMVGLAAAALQGAVVVTQDVDLWFENLADPNLRAALSEVGATYVPPFELNPPMFIGGGLDLFDVVIRMDGLNPFSEEHKNRLEIKMGENIVPALPLERILASKKAINRPKDRLVIPVIEDALKARSGNA